MQDTKKLISIMAEASRLGLTQKNRFVLDAKKTMQYKIYDIWQNSYQCENYEDKCFLRNELVGWIYKARIIQIKRHCMHCGANYPYGCIACPCCTGL